LLISPFASGGFAFLASMIDEEYCGGQTIVIVGPQGTNTVIPEWCQHNVRAIDFNIKNRKEWEQLGAELCAKKDSSSLLIVWEAWKVPTHTRNDIFANYPGRLLFVTINLDDLDAASFSAWYFLGHSESSAATILSLFGEGALARIRSIKPSNPRVPRKEYVSILSYGNCGLSITSREMVYRDALVNWIEDSWNKRKAI